MEETKSGTLTKYRVNNCSMKKLLTQSVLSFTVSGYLYLILNFLKMNSTP